VLPKIRLPAHVCLELDEVANRSALAAGQLEELVRIPRTASHVHHNAQDTIVLSLGDYCHALADPVVYELHQQWRGLLLVQAYVYHARIVLEERAAHEVHHVVVVRRESQSRSVNQSILRIK